MTATTTKKCEKTMINGGIYGVFGETGREDE